MKEYEFWLESPYIDDKTKEELKSVTDKKKIEDMFYRDLEFGTGGLRGIIGPGTNRMNIYIIRKTTQGLANHIKKSGKSAKTRGVVIAYDSRHKSREFAMEAAGVLSGNGIKAYVFEDIRPTPELSYAVRKLSTSYGIVITASHNPSEYNGYKVYGEDGAQIPPDEADMIQSEIKRVDDFNSIQYINLDTAKIEGLYSMIGQEIDTMYISDIMSLIINKDVIKEQADSFKIIYTPLHGTGNIPVRKSLECAGFKEVYIVKEQSTPDPNFPTVKSPNPEEHRAFDMAISMAQEINPDIILGTDPDCDRLGICVKDDTGKYITLTGNQVGALLTEYIISQLKKNDKLPENPVIIKTIVTSELGRTIASSYGVGTVDTLTGFKFIGEKIKEFQEHSTFSFIFGYEESYGYLAGTFVRDKDAVIASTLVCEMGAYYKHNRTSIYKALQDIYKKYGYYDEMLDSITLKGREGNDTILKIMDNLKRNPPHRIGIEDIMEIKDYNEGVTGFPRSNVLQFITNNKSIISIRPSGTEPKLKIYYSVNGKSHDDVRNRLSLLSEGFNSIINKSK